jgi:hypothetical protein
MPREKLYASEAEKKAAYRARKKLEESRYAEADSLGRRYGEDESDKRGLAEEARERRIARAIRYQRFLVDSAGVRHELG